jgi:hypothetical protein
MYLEFLKKNLKQKNKNGRERKNINIGKEGPEIPGIVFLWTKRGLKPCHLSLSLFAGEDCVFLFDLQLKKVFLSCPLGKWVSANLY